jgi:hypothetical protein
MPKSKSVISWVVCYSEIKNANALIKGLQDGMLLAAVTVCRWNSVLEVSQLTKFFVSSPTHGPV